MATSRKDYQPPMAEEYFSDDTQGRKEEEYMKREGILPPPIRAQRSLRRCQKRTLNAKPIFSELELNVQLDKIGIPRPSDPIDMHPVIRDGVFTLVSELLRRFGQGEWALRPRTFCILRGLGHMELMDSFVAQNRTDAFLPYDDRNLPDVIQGADNRSKFLKLQNLISSSTQGKELEEEGGAHCTFLSSESADKHFTVIKNLGQGAYGIIDHVFGPLSLKPFARKKLHRGASALKDEVTMERFAKELAVLKAASHRHLVKLVSSYTDPENVVVIMKPVADMDLKVYLRGLGSNESERAARQQCLRTFFGCLISALEYLHQHRIIHKDIKPHNVLVKHTDVYLTDFGTSRTIGELSHSLSSGSTSDETTPKYRAPEIVNHATRGKPSDIWSMGCVFLEMVTVLHNYSLDDMTSFFENNSSGDTHYWANQVAIVNWVKKIRSDSRSEDKEPLQWVEMMLQNDQDDRPSASQVLARITDSHSGHRYFCFRCLDNPNNATCPTDTGSNSSNEDLVTGELLQSYVQGKLAHDSRLCNSVREEQRADEDGTVTSKMLEEAGVIQVVGGALAIREGSVIKKGSAEGFNSGEEDTEKLETRTSTGKCRPEQLNSPKQDDRHNIAMVTPPKRSQAKSGGSDTPVTQQNLALPPKSALAKQAKARPLGKRVAFNESEMKGVAGPQRFQGLPKDRRPAASLPLQEIENVDETPIAVPDPLKSPPVDERDCYPLPHASLVPSYILAGTNRFTLNEVRTSDPTMGVSNLFVYGRLVFPSVFRAFTARSLEGTYSPIHQRRLVLSSGDWGGANMSIKRASEIMTPARLTGFDVWCPSHMECAVVQECSWTSTILENRRTRNLPGLERTPPGETIGFLVLGVSEEALRYCDLVFASDMTCLVRGEVVTDDEQTKRGIGGLLERQLVTTLVQLSTGEFRSVAAYTYVWTQGADHLWHVWRPEDFIRSPQFQRLSNVESVDWRVEELSLARTMGIDYALVGDELCAAILSDDYAKLKRLLRHDDDPDAHCRKFGTPLQAAVATDNEAMVRLLLSYGANPSLKGGKYGTPLIAAAVGSRRSITEILLKHRADVFASNPQYVNALYQAVGKGDWAIAHMLLEAGAWLSQDYLEIRDLAIERGDRDMQALLLKYDVRKALVKPIQYHGQPGEATSRDLQTNQGLTKTSTRVLKAVLGKLIVLNTRSGSWRGHKGVRMTRAALRAGAPPIILDYIRGAIDPIQKLIDILRAADKEQEEEYERVTEDEPRVQELGSDEETEEKDMDGTIRQEPEPPTIKVTDSDYDYIVVPSPQVGPLRSRDSSVDSPASVGSSDRDGDTYLPERKPHITEASHYRERPPLYAELHSEEPDGRYSRIPDSSSQRDVTMGTNMDHLGYHPIYSNPSPCDVYCSTFSYPSDPRGRASRPRRSTLDRPPTYSSYQQAGTNSQFLTPQPALVCNTPYDNAKKGFTPDPSSYRPTSPVLPMTSNYLAPALPLRRWNSERRSRPQSVYHAPARIVRPAVISFANQPATQSKKQCTTCGGHGWCRIIYGQPERERVREVHCPDCQASG